VPARVSGVGELEKELDGGRAVPSAVHWVKKLMVVEMEMLVVS
jgi:hypothetical protein